MSCNEVCGDNRFELIEKYKNKLLDSTNIDMAKDEMAVIDSILFRFWQMRWLDKLEQFDSQKAEIERLQNRNNKCVYLSDGETTEFCVDGPCPEFKTPAQIKVEAIKEFAKELIRKVEWTPTRGSFDYAGGYDDVLNKAKEIIDNLVKEMASAGDG